MTRRLSRRTIFGLAVATGLLSGCASYLSTQNNDIKPGLVYYLPMRPIIAQVTVTGTAAQRIETPSAGSASAVPDLSHRYFLTTMLNPISENKVSLSVSSAGLLQSANSTVTSGIVTILNNLAQAAGTVHGLSENAEHLLEQPLTTAEAPPTDNCQPGQTYNLIIWPGQASTGGPLCGWTVSLSPIPTSAATATEDIPAGGSGVYYRIEQPYLLTFTPSGGGGPSDSESFIVTSPDESATYFLPIERTIFANNTVTLSMKDGELLSFDQDNTGELVGLTSIPASIIGAYFSAISKIIPERITAQNAQMAAAIARIQLQQCQSSIAANPLKSGMSQSEQDTALANIKAGCAAATVPSSSP